MLGVVDQQCCVRLHAALQLFLHDITRDLWFQKSLWILGFSATSIKIIAFLVRSLPRKRSKGYVTRPLKPRANGRKLTLLASNSQYCWMLHACCVRLHTLLHVVGCCCVLLRKVWNWSDFSANNSHNSFVPWSPKRSATVLDPFAQLFQHCRGHAHYAWFTKTYGLYPSHDALQVATLLGVVASVCPPPPTRTQQQLPTLLGVVASVCTQPKNVWGGGRQSSSRPLRKQRVNSTGSIGHGLYLWLVDFDPFCVFLCFKVRCFPYQIQHYFECIFKLFFQTVFNLFCEIGFK